MDNPEAKSKVWEGIPYMYIRMVQIKKGLYRGIQGFDKKKPL